MEKPQKKNVKILIADDHESSRLSLSGILLKKGYMVQCVNSGTSALEAARSERFDLILLDIGLKDMNGVEVFFKLQELDPNISVLLMTAYSYEQEIIKAMQRGAYTVLYKPFDINYMLRVIEEMLEGVKRILVSGKITDRRDLLDKVQERYHVKNYYFESVEESLLQLKTRRFDVMVLFSSQSKISDLQFIEYVRTLRPKMALVVVGLPEVCSSEEANSHPGTVICLPKDHSPEQLEDALDRCLSGA